MYLKFKQLPTTLVLHNLLMVIMKHIIDELKRGYGSVSIYTNYLQIDIQDIIIGCETHLDEMYTSSEMFPQGFSIIRKDRCYGGGGVFLAISQSISYFNVMMTTIAEMIWAKITPSHGEPIIFIQVSAHFIDHPTITLTLQKILKQL